MKYIEQINAFYEWLEVNYLPASSRLLWHVLMQLDNRAGWPEWVTVDVHRLMSAIDVNSKDSLNHARNKLIEAGLIEYKRGRKHFPSQYRIIPFKRGENGIYSPVSIENIDTKSNRNSAETTSETRPFEEKNVSVENFDRKSLRNAAETASKERRKSVETSPHIKTKTNTKTKTKTYTHTHTSKSEKKEKVDFNLLMSFWNEHSRNMSKLVKMTDARKKRIHNLLNEWSKEDLEQVILKAEASDFMNGVTGDWKANFDWVINPKNFVKILEGNYDNISAPKKQNTNIYDEGAEYLSLVSEGKININAEVIDEPTTNRATNYADEGIISGVVYEIDS